MIHYQQLYGLEVVLLTHHDQRDDTILQKIFVGPSAAMAASVYRNELAASIARNDERSRHEIRREFTLTGITPTWAWGVLQDDRGDDVSESPLSLSTHAPES